MNALPSLPHTHPSHILTPPSHVYEYPSLPALLSPLHSPPPHPPVHDELPNEPQQLRHTGSEGAHVRQRGHTSRTQLDPATTHSTYTTDTHTHRILLVMYAYSCTQPTCLHSQPGFTHTTGADVLIAQEASVQSSMVVRCLGCRLTCQLNLRPKQHTPVLLRTPTSCVTYSRLPACNTPPCLS